MLNLLRVRVYQKWLRLKSLLPKKAPEPQGFVNPFMKQRQSGIIPDFSKMPPQNGMSFRKGPSLTDPRRSWLPGLPLGGSPAPAPAKKERHWFLKNCDDVMREDLDWLLSFTRERKKRREIAERNAAAYNDFMEMHFNDGRQFR